jgi:hypothetical protein
MVKNKAILTLNKVTKLLPVARKLHFSSSFSQIFTYLVVPINMYNYQNHQP